MDGQKIFELAVDMAKKLHCGSATSNSGKNKAKTLARPSLVLALEHKTDRRLGTIR